MIFQYKTALAPDDIVDFSIKYKVSEKGRNK